MKRLSSLLGLVFVVIIFGSTQASAQYHQGNGNNNSNWGNNNNWSNNGNYHNNGGNNGYYNNQCQSNYHHDNCGHHGYRQHHHGHHNGYAINYNYSFPAPCAQRTVVIYRSGNCAPAPHCSRW